MPLDGDEGMGWDYFLQNRSAMAESQIVEYKESWRDEYLKWICGFANAQGGVIYIGRKDDGTPCGVEDSKRLLEDIPNKVRDVLGLIVDVDLETMDGKDVVKIIVPENPYPVNYKGEYHYRTGSTKQLLQGSALTSFLLKKTGKKWDAVPLENVAVDDLDKESFDIFYREAVRSGRMSADDLKLSRHDLLEKLNLLDGEYLKRAAVLLFHRNPEKWITGSFVKIGFFDNDADLRYQDEIHGSLMIQADRVIDLLYTKYLTAEISYDNVTRIEHYPFPKDAVREAVFNALIHQDFAASIPVQISVYRDKLYISNDCIFPDNWTAETLKQKHRSMPLNPDIANTFYRAGFIESWGRGIEKICKLCLDYDIPAPEYTVHGADIMMLFRANVTSDVTSLRQVQLTDRQFVLCKMIEENPQVSVREMSLVMSLVERTIKRDLSAMQKMGILQREGNTSAGYWVINEDFKEIIKRYDPNHDPNDPNK